MGLLDDLDARIQQGLLGYQQEPARPNNIFTQIGAGFTNAAKAYMASQANPATRGMGLGAAAMGGVQGFMDEKYRNDKETSLDDIAKLATIRKAVEPDKQDMTTLDKYIRAMESLPEGHPRRALYQQAIDKEISVADKLSPLAQLYKDRSAYQPGSPEYAKFSEAIKNHGVPTGTNVTVQAPDIAGFLTQSGKTANDALIMGIDGTIQELDRTIAGYPEMAKHFTLQGKAEDWMNWGLDKIGMLSPEDKAQYEAFTRYQGELYANIANYRKSMSGLSLTVQEQQAADRYMPAPQDTPAQLIGKARGMNAVLKRAANRLRQQAFEGIDYTKRYPEEPTQGNESAVTAAREAQAPVAAAQTHLQSLGILPGANASPQATLGDPLGVGSPGPTPSVGGSGAPSPVPTQGPGNSPPAAVPPAAPAAPAAPAVQPPRDPMLPAVPPTAPPGTAPTFSSTPSAAMQGRLDANGVPYGGWPRGNTPAEIEQKGAELEAMGVPRARVLAWARREYNRLGIR